MSQPTDSTDTIDQRIVKLVEENYETKIIVSWNRKRNPHLDHACETKEYEVQARCHPKCVFETLHTIVYTRMDDMTNWQTVIAETTCGKLRVWAD